MTSGTRLTKTASLPNIREPLVLRQALLNNWFMDVDKETDGIYPEAERKSSNFEQCEWLNGILKLFVKEYIYSDLAKSFLRSWFHEKAALRLPDIIVNTGLARL